jgi:hypothetical protein
MKTSKVELLKWLPEEGEYIAIDWPKVHKTIGLEHTNWLITQPEDKCQLVVLQNDKFCRLVAEFYDEDLLINYHLMWAK